MFNFDFVDHQFLHCSDKTTNQFGSFSRRAQQVDRRAVLYGLMPDAFTYDVVVHRPEGTLNYMDAIHAMFVKGLSPHSMVTTIHEMIASGDYVLVRLSHKLTYSTEEAFMQSRLGRFDVRGKSVEWEAMVMFRFENGKIAEEWISNDELGQLMQIGTLELSVKGP